MVEGLRAVHLVWREGDWLRHVRNVRRGCGMVVVWQAALLWACGEEKVEQAVGDAQQATASGGDR